MQLCLVFIDIIVIKMQFLKDFPMELFHLTSNLIGTSAISTLLIVIFFLRTCCYCQININAAIRVNRHISIELNRPKWEDFGRFGRARRFNGRYKSALLLHRDDNIEKSKKKSECVCVINTVKCPMNFIHFLLAISLFIIFFNLILNFSSIFSQ